MSHPLKGSRGPLHQIMHSFHNMSIVIYQLYCSFTSVYQHFFISIVSRNHSFQSISRPRDTHTRPTSELKITPDIAITPELSTYSIRSMLSHYPSTLANHSLTDPIFAPITHNSNSLSNGSFISNP